MDFRYAVAEISLTAIGIFSSWPTKMVPRALPSLLPQTHVMVKPGDRAQVLKPEPVLKVVLLKLRLPYLFATKLHVEKVLNWKPWGLEWS